MCPAFLSPPYTAHCHASPSQCSSSYKHPLPPSLGIVMYTGNPCLLSLSSQGSIQQLTIYADPRTPEELCEAQESSVSLCLPPTLCTLTPPSARGRLVAQPFSPLSVRQPRSLSSWPALPQSYFGLLAFLHPLQLSSRLLGAGAVRLMR